MEAQLLIGSLAACAAFACGASAVLLLARSYRRRLASAVAAGGPDAASALIAWRLRKGYFWMRPFASLLLQERHAGSTAGHAVTLARYRGYTASAESITSVWMAAMLLAGVLSGALFGSLVAGAACAACAVAGSVVAVNAAYDKRKDAIRDAVPQALEAMQSCFLAGLTLLQTFQQVAHDIEGPLGEVFARSAHVLETGGTAQQALAVLKRDVDASELAFVAVALDVQHQSGGALRQVLQAAIETVKGELALRAALRVQTAQAKLSARVVAIMPLILVAAFSIASPDYLLPFFSSALGFALLLLAVVMQLAGIALVRHALSVQGVSR